MAIANPYVRVTLTLVLVLTAYHLFYEVPNDDRRDSYSQLKISYTKKAYTAPMSAQEAIVNYEAEARNIPKTKVKLTLCNHTHTCHLDRNCYSPLESPFHPVGCDSMLFPNPISTQCLMSRPLVVVGNSRTFWELLFGLKYHIMTAGVKDLELRRRDFTKHGKRGNTTTIIHKSGYLLLHQDGGEYEFDERTLDWKATLGEPPVKIASGGVTLFVGGLGAHVVALEERAKEFPDNLVKYLNSLRRLLTQARELQAKGEVHDIIYFSDAPPMRMKFQSNYMTEALSRLNLAVWSMLEKEFENVKVWTSHLAVSRIHAHICERFLLEEILPPEVLNNPNIQGISNKKDPSFLCPDTWHHGRIYYNGIAQMLLNHLCFNKTDAPN